MVYPAAVIHTMGLYMGKIGNATVIDLSSGGMCARECRVRACVRVCV